MKGHLRAGQSRTAILGYLAASAEGFSSKSEIAAWLLEKDIDIGERGIRDALDLRRSMRPDDSRNPDECGWLRDAVSFDAIKLDLDQALVIFSRVDDVARMEDALRSTKRLIRIQRTYERDLIATLIYSGAQERQRLQTLVEELDPQVKWAVIRATEESVASETWLALARQSAKLEGLLRTQV